MSPMQAVAPAKYTARSLLTDMSMGTSRRCKCTAVLVALAMLICVLTGGVLTGCSAKQEDTQATEADTIPKDVLSGYWQRQPAADGSAGIFDGMVVEVVRRKDGCYNASIVTVTDDMKSIGFSVGDIKWALVTADAEKGVYTLYDFGIYNGKEHWYPMIMRVNTINPDLITLEYYEPTNGADVSGSDAQASASGAAQTYIRIDPNTIQMPSASGSDVASV